MEIDDVQLDLDVEHQHTYTKISIETKKKVLHQLNHGPVIEYPGAPFHEDRVELELPADKNTVKDLIATALEEKSRPQSKRPGHRLKAFTDDPIHPRIHKIDHIIGEIGLYGKYTATYTKGVSIQVAESEEIAILETDEHPRELYPKDYRYAVKLLWEASRKLRFELHWSEVIEYSGCSKRRQQVVVIYFNDIQQLKQLIGKARSVVKRRAEGRERKREGLKPFNLMYIDPVITNRS